jgi:hypothetical protein
MVGNRDFKGDNLGALMWEDNSLGVLTVSAGAACCGPDGAVIVRSGMGSI